MGTARGPVPSQRVSNSDLKGELELLHLQLENVATHMEQRLMSEIEMMKAAVRSSERGLKDKISVTENSLKDKIGDHLKYHRDMLQTAKEIADKRLKVMTLVISFLAVCATVTIAIVSNS